MVLCAVKKLGAALKFAKEAQRGDARIVMAAVKCDGLSLRYASDELRGHRLRVDAARAAIIGPGVAAEADKVFQRAKVVALAAVRQNADAFKYVSEELRLDRKLALTAVKGDWRCLRRVPRPPFELVPMPAPHPDAFGPSPALLRGLREFFAARLLQRRCKVNRATHTNLFWRKGKERKGEGGRGKRAGIQRPSWEGG